MSCLETEGLKQFGKRIENIKFVLCGSLFFFFTCTTQAKGIYSTVNTAYNHQKRISLNLNVRLVGSRDAKTIAHAIN